jgi:kinesin family protein 15
MSEDHIKVACRIRPANQREGTGSGSSGVRKCVSILEDSNTVLLNSKPESKAFSFDFAADENVTQDEIFREVGLPITRSCLEGYNGTILCYGQTGSGKTFTTFGASIDAMLDDDQHSMNASSKAEDRPVVSLEESRGLVPRALEHLLESIEETRKTKVNYSATCKCSFYEIYQEKVFDLLDIASHSVAGLSVREDSKEGVYVEGCTETVVTSVKEAHRILVQGYKNRHVAETSMNRESSRSHAVFQLSIETTETRQDGVTVKRNARFSMVDLAGSERQKDTNATGDRLKEASVINKSLSTLGHVINTLAETSTSGGRRHIHYRDSKLTFLLRDSLGGNSKVYMHMWSSA